ncbi:MAG: GtrA family protein [Gammaproteobacteria bacterium]|nr:GtrA family protein [Gammaproteobacteria bacterium]MBQ0839744.1 GtrA family protein [Gammaproteobacteria bacterium]
MASSRLTRQAQRFALSGLLVTGIHVFSASGLILLLVVDPPIANGLAFVVATVFSYTINTLWSFSSPLHGRNLIRFMAVSMFGCFLAVSVASAAQHYDLHYLYGIGLVALVVPPATFLLHSFWTYR